MSAPKRQRTSTARKSRSASDDRPERRNQATLEIGPGVVSDEAIRGLLEDWIIPSIVEELLRERISAAPRSEPSHLTTIDL
jgi:hypothetical protein